jgi:hypothetical protein
MIDILLISLPRVRVRHTRTHRRTHTRTHTHTHTHTRSARVPRVAASPSLPPLRKYGSCEGGMEGGMEGGNEGGREGGSGCKYRFYFSLLPPPPCAPPHTLPPSLSLSLPPSLRGGVHIYIYILCIYIYIYIHIHTYISSFSHSRSRSLSQATHSKYT